MLLQDSVAADCAVFQERSAKCQLPDKSQLTNFGLAAGRLEITLVTQILTASPNGLAIGVNAFSKKNHHTLSVAAGDKSPAGMAETVRQHVPLPAESPDGQPVRAMLSWTT